MDALIEKLEAAQADSQELDEAIARLVHNQPDCPIIVDHDYGICLYPEPGEYIEVLHYTRSLDAALSLVSDEARPFFMVTFSAPAKAGAHDGNREFLYFEGATPALALCIAALKERAAKSSPKAA